MGGDSKLISSSSPSTSKRNCVVYNSAGLLPAGKAFVAGGTGRTGRQIIRLLREQKIEVRTLVRDRQRAAQLLPPPSEDFEILVGDVYQYDAVQRAVAGSEYVFIATGATPGLDPLGPFKVDYEGTKNIVAAAKAAGVKHVVLVTSLGVSQILFPLNLFWGILFWKKQAEEYLQRSGLKYTIVRPGGLKDTLKDGEKKGNIVMKGADELYGGGILRSQVAEVAVAAIAEPEAANKIVEIIADVAAPEKGLRELFTSIQPLIKM